MANEKLRQQILFEAARLMYHRQETEYYRAKLKAARKICRGWVKPSDLPSNREISEAIQRFAIVHEGDSRDTKLHDMRLAALRIMRLLKKFRPRLIGSTLTGRIRQGSDIDIHVFAGSDDAIAALLDYEGLSYDIEHKRVRKHGEERLFTHIHVQNEFPIELTVYPADKAHYVFKSSITGKAIERASITELEELLHADAAEGSLEEELADAESGPDRFQVYRALMLPLEHVTGSRKMHPEGDVLYHSLQVYDLAREELPYDEEFQLAALLHDVGKGIDPHNHVETGLEALAGFITERTAWLIEHHMEAHAVRDGTIGVRARRRLKESDDFDELMLLERCDRQGRQVGVDVPELDEALDDLRELSQMYG